VLAIDLLLIAVGLVVLILGGYMLLHAAVAIATSLGMSRTLVGATVVAIGTSAPELFVGITAVLRGADGITVGNVMGEGVSNVGLVLGVAAVVNPAVLFTRLRRTAVPVLLAATALFLLAAADGEIARWQGAVLLGSLVLVILFARQLFPEMAAAAEAEAAQRRGGIVTARRPVLLQVAFLLGAVAALGLGAHLVVEGATAFAREIGMSEVAVGVVIVSLGTASPELVTSVMAAVKREYEISVANVLGSNIFNLLGVMGIVAMINPVTVDPGVFRVEAPALVIAGLALIPFAMGRPYRVTRVDGALLLGLYAAYVALVLDRGL
jgi:cation:H+ antiporter